MTKIIFEFDVDWILQHRNDEPLPMQCLAEYLRNETAFDVIDEPKYDSIVVEYIGDADVNWLCTYGKELIVSFFDKYSDFDPKYITCCKCCDDLATEAFTDDDSDDSSDLDELISKLCEETSQTSDSKLSDDKSDVFDKIDNLINGEEFKLFAKELRTLAPQIAKNNTGEVLLAQKYLFSISDGCGLENFLNLMRDLFNALNLPNISLRSETLVGKIPPLESKPQDIEEFYLRDFTSYRRDRRIVCVDISEWMGKSNGEDFRHIIEHLLKLRSGDIVVFTVPFVDKEILNSMKDALNDLMFIRTLTFPPLNNEQIKKYAKKEMESFGFAIQESAWTNLHHRIVEENRDGRFHGIETVKKVVRELLYKKQLSNAIEGTDDHIIREKDTAGLCQENFADSMSGVEMLDRMVGTEAIKQKVLEIIAQIKLSRQNANLGTPCLHMRFLGNPGTGKTTVARIIGKILKENGILRIGEFHEHSGRDFCGRYIGETAPKTSGICRDAYGSVLFIDEAYSLFHGADDVRDFGREALDTLIAEMENHRQDLVVIMAGYTDDMERLMQGNLGLQSRMPYSIEFPNFTREQLFDIFCSMVGNKIDCEPAVFSAAKDYFLNLDENWVNSKQFSNGRFVRNLFERCCAKAAMRCQLEGIEKTVLTLDDFNRSIGDKEFLAVKKKRKIGFGD